MKAKKCYTAVEIDSMSVEKLREVVISEQNEMIMLHWKIREIQELLIAALQSLPKKNVYIKTKKTKTQMEAKKCYTTMEINSMSVEKLREAVISEQNEMMMLHWKTREIQELLIAALQSLPKKNIL